MAAKNFRNPLGLLGRMLASGDRVAYATLMHEALRRSAPPFDWMLQRRERRLLKHAPDSSLPLVLIVGAPRSGTTLVYQTLARYLDASYFTNLSSFFPKSPIAATRMLARRRQRKADFQNFYGQTARLSGPHDGFFVWDRWLGDDRYHPNTHLTEEQRGDMRRFFRAWTSAVGKPFVNKNNRNTSCVDLLASILPKARFVIVRRDPVFAAQSLIRARERVQGDKRKGWGLAAAEEANGDPLSYVDDVCRQLESIEQKLQKQTATIAPARVIPVQYEDFCDSPADHIARIGEAAGVELMSELMTEELSRFEVSKKISVSPEELDRIRQYFPLVKLAQPPDLCVSC